jgi:hypothetical protein
MRFRALIRLTALAVVFTGATMQQPRELSAMDGCGSLCEDLSESFCYWPTEQQCLDYGQDECEIYLSMFGEDCERACDVDSYCDDGSGCTGPDAGKYEWTCDVYPEPVV